MSKKVKKILLIVFIIILIFTLGFSVFVAKEVFNGFTDIIPRQDTLKFAKGYEKEFKDFAREKDVEYIEIQSSKYEHKIPAILVKNPGNKNIAVLVHGLGGTKTSLPHIMDVFLDLGYDVLAIDQRNSGDNKALYNTFGVLESFDILDAVKTAKSKIDKNGKIILWGESYGGASVAIAAGRDDSNIDYLILESPVDDSNEMLDDKLFEIEKSQKIPASFMKFTSNLYTIFKLHFSYNDINASKWMSDVSVPVLITNSDKDELSPTYMGENLYRAVKHDRKKIYTAKSFGHTEFPKKDREEYKNLILEFLENYR
ncbi:alpha/beta hydrolase [Peptoniphilus obesi]|uniref:alpha/beta hydrolase n=1 Tax=Peptoniphilus obesi TaxID=1472765 RepID=UPI0004B9F57E|nr:alpha/beta fold hydrolase [Peptoniphilus obesi]